MIFVSQAIILETGPSLCIIYISRQLVFPLVLLMVTLAVMTLLTSSIDEETDVKFLNLIVCACVYMLQVVLLCRLDVYLKESSVFRN